MKLEEPKLEDLLENLQNNFSEDDLEDVKKAFLFASEKHAGKTRLTDEPFITHPLKRVKRG